MGGTKLERFLPKNQHTQRKWLNFGNWVNGKVPKIILESKVIKILMLKKYVNDNN